MYIMIHNMNGLDPVFSCYDLRSFAESEFNVAKEHIENTNWVIRERSYHEPVFEIQGITVRVSGYLSFDLSHSFAFASNVGYLLWGEILPDIPPEEDLVYHSPEDTN